MNTIMVNSDIANIANLPAPCVWAESINSLANWAIQFDIRWILNGLINNIFRGT